MSLYDASSSWSGYQYQGKVTIYIALKLINEFIKNKEELKEYCIEVERREDLAIKKGEKYISFHQVKARKGDIYMNDYLEAIDKLLIEKDKNPTSNIYLHTIVAIKDWSEEKFIKLYTDKINKLEKEIKTIEEKKEKDDIKFKKMESKKKELELMKIKLNNSKRVNEINLYEYFNKKYCSLNDIQIYIDKEIKDYLKSTNQNNKLGDIDVVHNKLICFMDNYIKQRHLNKVTEYFSLIEIKNILDDNYLERDRIFHLSLIKDKYCSYNFDDFCNNFCCEKEKCQNNQNACEMFKTCEYLLNSNLDDLEKILKKINPHVNICEWELDRDKFLNENGMRFLYDTISNIIKQEIELNNKSIKYSNKGISYIPTTINLISPRYKNSTIELYKKSIINNDNLLNELFEDNIFITENLCTDNILENINDVKEVNEKLEKKEKSKEDKNYLEYKVRFKDIESVEVVLNND